VHLLPIKRPIPLVENGDSGGQTGRVRLFAHNTALRGYRHGIEGTKMKWLSGQVFKKCLLVLIALAVLAIATLYACRLLAIDRCLDSGGRWDYENGVCER